jgi:hypothetical protein
MKVRLAAQEPQGQENWHPRLTDCFEAFGPGSERLHPAKLKVSLPLFAGILAIWANDRNQPVAVVDPEARVRSCGGGSTSFLESAG